MKPVNFPQANAQVETHDIATGQPGELHACLTHFDTGHAAVVTKWELEPGDLEKIKENNGVYLIILGETMQPPTIWAENPFFPNNE